LYTPDFGSDFRSSKDFRDFKDFKDSKISKGFRPDFKELRSGSGDSCDFKPDFMDFRPDFRNFG